MSVTLSLFAGAGAQFLDNSGNVLSGGKIYTYAAGTTTPAPTYTTLNGNVSHTNPIVLDSAGRVPAGGEIWLPIGVGYKFVLKTSTDVLISTYDNIPSAAQSPAANDADSIMYEQGYTLTAGSFIVGKIYRIVSIGTTDFTLIGATANTVGLHFMATGVGTGTGTAELSQTVETKLRESVSVLDFGADPTNTTDSTAAIQAAVNAVNAAGGGTIYFPSGTYMVTMVNTYAGIIFEGSGGAVLKRPPMQPNFTRMFTFNPTTVWSQQYDSPPVQFKNLILDGNRDNQGAYNAYQQEQSHLIFLVADATKAGRLRAVIENCTFLDCVADAISVYENVDVAVDNCFVQNAFRGGFVLTGGFTRFRVSNLVIKGTVQSRGIDFEIDGPGFGGDYRTTGTMTNVETNGCFDVSVGNNSRISMSNITYGDVSEYAGFNLQSLSNAQLNLSNSSFILVGGDHLRQIRFSSDVRIDNCLFLYDNPVATGSTLSLVVYAETSRNLMMDNCRFGVTTGSVLTDTIYALEFTAGNSSDHKAKISDCVFDLNFDAAVACLQGGYVSMNNCFINCDTGLVFGGSGSFPLSAEMIDCTVGIYNTHLWNQQSNNTGTSLYVAGSIEGADYSTTGVGGTGWYYKSDLTVFGPDANPNTASVFGNPNDTYKQKGFPIYGSSGTPVMYIGSAVSGPPYFNWVPINRD